MPPNAIILLRFNEPDSVLVSDELRNLDDLNKSGTGTVPLSVDTYTGKGRSFVAASSRALLAADLAGRDTLLQRDATIQAIVALTNVAGVQVLIARGLNSGAAAENHSLGLEIHHVSTRVEARWFWQTNAGALKVQPAGVWQHLGDGKFFLLTATRRWVSASKVVVRYYVGADLIAEIETADGDIGGGTTGRTTVGARQDTGVWEHFFNGVIDELLVTDHEMSPEEVRHAWRRIAEYQPGGLDTMVGLVPPGLPWAKDLGNSVGRTVKHAAEAVGFAAASAEELRALWLPDAAPLGIIERWEKLLDVTRMPVDWLDSRRARLLALLGREEGFSRPAVRAALQEPLDLPANDIEILEFSNIVTDDFTTLNTEKWSSYGTGGGSTIAIVASQLKLSAAAGSDVRWHEKLLSLHARMPLNRGDAITVHAYAYLASHVLANDTGYGLFLHNRITNDTLWFGVFRPGAAASRLGYRTVIGGTLGAFVTIVDPAPASCWLRITPPSTVAGQWTLSYSTVGPNTAFTHTLVTIGDLAFDWAGFGAFGLASASGGVSEATFDDFKSFCPRGLRPFSWYAIHNPLAVSSPDLDGSQLVARKVRPAYTYAGVSQSKSIMPDDPLDGLCDHGPCGGW